MKLSPVKVGGWIDPASYGVNSSWYLGHTFRYLLASGFLRPTDTVIDAACGTGYGSFILSRVAEVVIGIELDSEALAIATKKYHANNIVYRQEDLRSFLLPTCDVAVSFETIEHLDNPQWFMEQLRRAAQRLLVVSAPVIKTTHVNKHHKHDFDEDSFLGLLRGPGWKVWEKVRQGPYLVVVLYNEKDFDGY